MQETLAESLRLPICKTGPCPTVPIHQPSQRRSRVKICVSKLASDTQSQAHLQSRWVRILTLNLSISLAFALSISSVIPSAVRCNTASRASLLSISAKTISNWIVKSFFVKDQIVSPVRSTDKRPSPKKEGPVVGWAFRTVDAASVPYLKPALDPSTLLAEAGGMVSMKRS